MRELHPGTDPIEQLEQLSLVQLKQLRARSAKARKPMHAVSLVRQNRDQRLPLSFAQERLWFLDQLALVGSSYNMPMVLQLDGALNTAALERSLEELVRRHEILRTRFELADGSPVQVIDSPRSYVLRMSDLSALQSGEQSRTVQRVTVEEAQTPFDLTSSAPFRATLLKLSSQRHVLLMTMHHIVADGWSHGVLNKELGLLYAAYSEGRDSPLPELPIQYADYALWQRNWLQGPELHKHLDYWRQRLDGITPLQLPTDRPRPAVASFRGAATWFTLPQDLSEQLRQLARARGATLYMILLAAFQVLLSRYSGQEDIAVGSPIAGRQNQEVENLIGFFVNTLVLRTDLTGNPTFLQLLERVKETTLDAYAHQALPFEKLVVELRPERNLTTQPLFQVMLALQNFPQEELQLAGLSWTWDNCEHVTAKFDLMLHLFEESGALGGAFEYATDLFDPATIERMAEHLQILLRGIATRPESPIQQLPILSPAEQHTLLQAWSGPTVRHPQERCMHELFEEQVARTPEAPAVIFEQRTLSYADLNARANQLARYLRDQGVGPEHLVGLCVERNADMIVGLLGILKAGGAYVPLDPNYPAERLAQILEDAQPGVVLTQGQLGERLPNTATQLVLLDRDWSAIAQRASDNLDSSRLGLHPHHLAYIIYTSGSTGKPKGTAIEHRNAVNFLHWARAATQAEVFERTLQSTSLNFDLSVYECFVPLTLGGCVRVVQDALALVGDPGDVTLINTVPSAIAAIVDSGGIPATVRVVNLAGEALKRELVEKIFANSQVEQVCNLYGPSETTTYSTWTAMSRQKGFDRSIGRPIDNTQIRILDPFRQLVPIGVTGEIYIGGAGVARGYLNRPQQTDERFLPDPFSNASHARLYKTGDLGRWLPNGTIEYLGRNDHQVKIRGYRIELGEIEAQLTRHECVKEAVVVAREDIPGDKRLVAYIVGDRSAAQRTVESGRTSKALQSEMVGEWQAIWKDAYAAPAVGPSFEGWNSSYTGQPIPDAQMQEWLTGTIGRIQVLRPRRILELGCGLGLLLQHLAPDCEVYVGTDFSSSALASLRQWLGARESLEHVQLLQRSASDLGDLPAGSFDMVVLNSVVQYFPDVDYLLAVLRDALRLLAPGGRVFIGDVRHLGLLQTFHGAVQLGKAAATVNLGQLRKRIARAMTQEKELVIDPAFYEALPGNLPGIAAAEIQLKRGRSSNELTRYRYDVVLHTSERPTVDLQTAVLKWHSGASFNSELEAALEEHSGAVRLWSVPNSRLAKEAAAGRMIEAGDTHLEAGVLRRRLTETEFGGCDPETFWELAAARGLNARISWADPADHFDVQFVDPQSVNRPGSANRPLPPLITSWQTFTNDPLDSSFRQQLLLRLREDLKAQLPEYMVPSAWMALKQLPLTPNGKVDRRALPAPEDRPEEMGDYVAPRTEVERALAEIWEQVLRVDQVGARDNFFELGGHSLLGVKLIARIAQKLEIRFSVVAVFQHPTLEKMALAIETAREANAFDEGVV